MPADFLGTVATGILGSKWKFLAVFSSLASSSMSLYPFFFGIPHSFYVNDVLARVEILSRGQFWLVNLTLMFP